MSEQTPHGQPPPSSADARERLLRLAELRDDQRRRWLAGDRHPAEACLEQRPTLAADAEAAIDLIYSEFLLREELGERPSAEEYLRRFPHLAAGLQRQLDLHAALQSGEDSGPDSNADDLAPTLRLTTASVANGTGAMSLPDYEILDELGRGGMGVVYRARQRSLKRVVALKMLTAGPRAEREQLSRFRAEAAMIARLRHPGIVPIFEAGEYEGRPYFTMEYVEGGSLAQRLAATPLEPRAAAQLLESVARAIQYAHEQGIVHRDLKPSNILMTADGAPRVADFGLAKSLAADESDSSATWRTETGAVLGTPAYMAPEQAVAGKKVGPPGDVYSLGAILYECLTGRPPFRAPSVLETLEQVRSVEPLPPSRLAPGLPRDLETICLQCLQKDAARRYGTARALADDLGRFLRSEPIWARRVSACERLLKWVRRKPTLAALLIVSALALVALIGGGVAHNVRLDAEVERAEANAAEAQRQQERADVGYRAAADTLNRMLGRLAARRPGEISPLGDVQRQQLEDALEFYQGILDRADSAADPRVRRDTAVASRRAGEIQQTLGRPGPAATNYRRSIELLEGLPQDERDSLDNQQLLAGCHNNLGLLALDAQHAGEAERHHQTARDIFERLHQLRPETVSVQTGLAESEHDLGIACHRSDRPDEAVRHYNRAVELRLALLRDHPDDEGQQAALAGDYTNLAILHQTHERLSEATANYEKADALLRPLVTRNPQGESALTQAAMYVNWLYLLWASGQPLAAFGKSNRAVELAEAVFAQQPRHLGARLRVKQAHGVRAEICGASFLWAAAARDWDRVIELEDPPEPWHRVLRALALAKAGEHARAVAEVRAVEDHPELDANALFSLACTCALASASVRADARTASAERATLAENHAVQAIVLLRKLRARGSFKDTFAEKLRTSPDLQSLSNRSDFAELLGPR